MTRAAAVGVRPYLRRRSQYLAEAQAKDDFAIGRSLPCFEDRDAEAGGAVGHYFHQDLYVAQQIYAANPRRHVDVGSRIDGFIAHVASFRPVEVYDIRPVTTVVPNVTFRVRDIMIDDSAFDQCTDSLSSLHAIEHFGLGRYGDSLDYYGYRTGFENLARMVQRGGTFYFVVPIGENQRIEFEAHRIFSIPYLLGMIQPLFRVDRFAFVDDAGDMHLEQSVTSPEAARTFGLVYGCGIFTLRRL